MSDLSRCQWRHFQAHIILCAVRWCLRYALSSRDIEELLRACGLVGRSYDRVALGPTRCARAGPAVSAISIGQQ
jgi:hypothetical protein